MSANCFCALAIKVAASGWAKFIKTFDDLTLIRRPPGNSTCAELSDSDMINAAFMWPSSSKSRFILGQISILLSYRVRKNSNADYADFADFADESR